MELPHSISDMKISTYSRYSEQPFMDYKLSAFKSVHVIENYCFFFSQLELEVGFKG